MDPLAPHDIALVRAPNPGPFTLSGTNTWLAGRDPCWVVDPGPDDEAHRAAVAAEAAARGGAAGIALTHDHADHAAGAPALRDALGAPVWASRWPGADERIGDGGRAGPLEAVATPGHAADHLAYVAGAACFTGDAVLGEGSVFVTADLAAYLSALRGLAARGLAVLCPGHGPPVSGATEKLEAYVAHRLHREERLVEALAAGLRGVGELLDRVWDDAPPPLRPAAAATLGAHLGKLAEEGRLPPGVERPVLPDFAV